MPEEGIQHIPHGEILRYEEICRIVAAAADLGISRVRLTGGEPLARADLLELVRMLSDIEAITDLSMTTNGILLARYASELKEAGLQRVNVSLDTLRPQRFRQVTRCGELEGTLQGIEAARATGLNPVKINVVAMAGTNDDELIDFAVKTVNDGWHVRFIELMPFSGNGSAQMGFLSVAEMRERLLPLGQLEVVHGSVGNGPAKYFRLPGAPGTIGFITPVTEHFCFQCNRLRLTADGGLRPCLMSNEEIDLKAPLRAGISTEELKALINRAAIAKPRGHNLADGDIPGGRSFSQVGG
jgi:cyclic pyranopterin phosphate synthase